MGWWRRRSGPDREASVPAASNDRNRVVLAGVVPLWQAPMILAGLDELDITGTFAESSSRRMMIGGPPSARIYVFERDREAAERFIAEVTGAGA